LRPHELGRAALSRAAGCPVTASSKAGLQYALPVASPTPSHEPVPWQAFPEGAPQLRVGLLMKNIDNLQLESQTFTADGWYWLQWGEDLEKLRHERNLQPSQFIEFANQVEAWDSRIEEEIADAQRLKDGPHYELFRFSARFYIDTIDERHSPFETVVLPVVVETRPGRRSSRFQGQRSASCPPEISDL
jgi:hypothetical protein